VRFVKLHYAEAEIEPAGVPALLAYRGGDKFAGLVPLLDEIPDEEELSGDSLAAALKRFVLSRCWMEFGLLTGWQASGACLR